MSSSSSSRPSATQLFRSLRDDKLPELEKLETARSAWQDSSFRFPKQREFLLEWLLTRLLKTKDDLKLVTAEGCWTFLESLLDGISAESLAAILGKVPTLPVLCSFFSRGQSICKYRGICAPAARTWDVILPLAASRANADSVLAALSELYQAVNVSAKVKRCEEWIQLVELAATHLAAAARSSSPSVQKSTLQTFLKQHLPSLLKILASTTETSQTLAALQAPLCSIAFSSSQLHKVVSRSDRQDVDFTAAWSSAPQSDRARALPLVFAAYVRCLRDYIPTFIAATPSISRSVVDSQSTLLIRSAAFKLLSDASAEGSLFTDENVLQVLQTVSGDHLYAPTLGHSEQWKSTLNALLSAASQLSDMQQRTQSLALVATIEPTLVDHRIKEVLNACNLHSYESESLLEILRTYFIRTRRVPELVDALVKAAPTSALPLSQRQALAAVLSTSLPPAQALELTRQMISDALAAITAEHQLESPASPPPIKKQKRSSVSKGRKKSSEAVSTIDMACLVLQTVEPPFTDQAEAADLVCGALKTLHVEKESLATGQASFLVMQLSVALVSWLLRHESHWHGRLEGLRASLDQAAANVSATLQSKKGSRQAKYYAVLLAFCNSSAQQQSDSQCLAGAFDFALGLAATSPPTSRLPEVAAVDDDDALGSVCWQSLLDFAPAFSAFGSASQVQQFSDIVLSHYVQAFGGQASAASHETSTMVGSTMAFLESPELSSSLAIKEQVQSKLAGLMHKQPALQRSLLRLPYHNMSSSLRKLAADSASKTAPGDEDRLDATSFLIAHVQAGSPLPKVDNDLARSVQEACQPKNDGFTQALAGSSKEAIEQALELQLAALQEGARIDSVSPKELHLLRDFLCQAPTGSGRKVTSAFSMALRFLKGALFKRQDPEVAAAAVTFISAFTSHRPRGLDHADVAAIFALFALLLQPSGQKSSTPAHGQAIFSSILSSVSTLVRHRKDIVVALFPALMQVVSGLLTLLRPLPADSASLPFWASHVTEPDQIAENARLYGRLLTNMTAKTVQQKSAASTNMVSSLHGALSKHAGYYLLSFLRASTAGQAPLSPTTRAELLAGLNEIIATMNKFERDSLMHGLLTSRDDAERVLLRGLWKDYDRMRYKGQA